jgi:hypothetical protein
MSSHPSSPESSVLTVQRAANVGWSAGSLARNAGAEQPIEPATAPPCDQKGMATPTAPDWRLAGFTAIPVRWMARNSLSQRRLGQLG